MLVRLQFESIGRHKRQDGGLGLDRCSVFRILIVSADVAAAQSDYETRHGAHSRRAASRRAPMVPALEVFDLSAICPLRHKGLLCWGAYGSSVGLRGTLTLLPRSGLRSKRIRPLTIRPEHFSG